MKQRVITFALAGCLVSSLAFADNPTDAPLLPNDGSAAVVQQENSNRPQPQARKQKGRIFGSKGQDWKPFKEPSRGTDQFQLLVHCEPLKRGQIARDPGFREEQRGLASPELSRER
jgi:hypothetical protein